MPDLYLIALSYDERKREQPRRIADALSGFGSRIEIIGKRDGPRVKVRIPFELVGEVRTEVADFCTVEPAATLELL